MVDGEKLKRGKNDMLIIHHNDLDGKCAAAIAYQKEKDQQKNIRFYETDYKMPPPTIKPNEIVYIVDFSYDPTNMSKITNKSNNVVWCDHHKTAKSYGYDFDGFRDFSEKGLAGCECTWKHCFPDKDIPRAVRVLGSYDSWRFNDEDEEETKAFYEGLKLQDVEPDGDFWQKLFNDEKIYDDILTDGKIAIKYRDAYLRDLYKNNAYEVTFDGISCLALNVQGFGSAAFGEDLADYDACIAYIYDGNEYAVSLYSENVDVGEMCKKHGGGGHKGAAGFTCKKLPWQNEVSAIAQDM